MFIIIGYKNIYSFLAHPRVLITTNSTLAMPKGAHRDSAEQIAEGLGWDKAQLQSTAAA